MRVLAILLASFAFAPAGAAFAQAAAVQPAQSAKAERKAEERGVREREGQEAKERRQRERAEQKAERERERKHEEPPVEPPPVEPESTLKIGLEGLTGGDNGSPDRAQAEIAERATDARYDRVDVTSSLPPRITEGVKWGIKSLVLYSPGLMGRSSSKIESDMRKLAAEMKPLGLTEIELGNETYFENGFNATEYAAEYKVAHAALAGDGITLIANLWDDSRTPKTSIESNGGWGKAIANYLGYVPDAWSLHPYGGMSEDDIGETQGWLVVPEALKYMKQFGYAAPLQVTEVGQPIWTGTDGAHAVSEAKQAADVETYIEDSAKWGLDAFYYFAMADYTKPGGASEGGYGLYDVHLHARPAAKAFGEAARVVG
jgi:hypothetical protein